MIHQLPLSPMKWNTSCIIYWPWEFYCNNLPIIGSIGYRSFYCTWTNIPITVILSKGNTLIFDVDQCLTIAHIDLTSLLHCYKLMISWVWCLITVIVIVVSREAWNKYSNYSDINMLKMEKKRKKLTAYKSYIW